MKGPDGAIIPRSPGASKKEEEPLKQADLEEDLGFNGPRKELREESDAEVIRAAGKQDAMMDRELFIESVGQLWDFDRASAKACFTAGDADGSGLINIHEWLILREAFVHQSEETAKHPIVRNLQLRAALFSYDVDANGHLSRDEVMTWLRDLCAGESHLQRIAKPVFKALDSEKQGRWPIPQAVQEPEDEDEEDEDEEPGIGTEAFVPLTLPPDLKTSSSQWSVGSQLDASGKRSSSMFIDDNDTDNFDNLKPPTPLKRQASSKKSPGLSENHFTIERIAAALSHGGKLEAWLEENSLSTADLIANFFRSHTFGTRMRVVYDGRADTARSILEKSVVKGANFDPTKPPSLGVTTDGVPGYAVSEGMTLLPSLRAVGGWRGPLAVQRNHSSYYLAAHIIDTCERLALEARILEADMPDDVWRPDGSLLKELLGSGEKQQADCIVLLADACRRAVAAQPVVVRVQAPAKVFGDVHGQLRDLLLLFGWYGFPSHKGGDIQVTSYVFNGDWVDRGPHQLETICLLFALKIMYPSQVILVRGNHEFRGQNEEMGEAGFKYAMKKHLQSREHGMRAYEAIHNAFDWLPLAALVNESVLVLHGGVGDGSWSLAELAKIPRPLVDEHDHACTLQCLWSDPSDSDAAMRSGVHPSKRGEGIPEFGPDVTAKFCKDNHISLVIRAHQFCRQGYKVMHSGRLITLFSARNYFKRQGGTSNDGAMLLLTPDGNGHLRVHPKRLEQLDASGKVNYATPPAEDDWRVKFLGSLAKCMSV